MNASDDITQVDHLRALPAVNTVLKHARIKPLIGQFGHASVLQHVRQWIDACRCELAEAGTVLLDYAQLAGHISAQEQSSLIPVLNGTGVVVHTNLGRAPLASAALQAVSEISQGYSNLEFDLHSGRRGLRHSHSSALLRELCGAEDAVVVNNNAAAVLLLLSTLASQRSVIVSRGELVEIGGSFRIPDVMRQSGARLVEVGSTNRTRLGDYQQAIDDDTALLLKVHQSNFAMVGFTETTPIKALASLAHQHNLPLVYDAGSGILQHSELLRDEPTIHELLDAGVDLVSFSGDKLLGGPQAGIIAGRADLVARCRRHPLMRALRPDKMSLAALNATLQIWRTDPQRVPVHKMIHTRPDELKKRARQLAKKLQQNFKGDNVAVHFDAQPCLDRVGGGSSPLLQLDGWALRIRGPGLNTLQGHLRDSRPALIARLLDDALWISLRSLLPAQDLHVYQVLNDAMKSS